MLLKIAFTGGPCKVSIRTGSARLQVVPISALGSNPGFSRCGSPSVAAPGETSSSFRQKEIPRPRSFRRKEIACHRAEPPTSPWKSGPSRAALRRTEMNAGFSPCGRLPPQAPANSPTELNPVTNNNADAALRAPLFRVNEGWPPDLVFFHSLPQKDSQFL